jgi:hypothetical protein
MTAPAMAQVEKPIQAEIHRGDPVYPQSAVENLAKLWMNSTRTPQCRILRLHLYLLIQTILPSVHSLKRNLLHAPHVNHAEDRVDGPSIVSRGTPDRGQTIAIRSHCAGC